MEQDSPRINWKLNNKLPWESLCSQWRQTSPWGGPSIPKVMLHSVFVFSTTKGLLLATLKPSFHSLLKSPTKGTMPVFSQSLMSVFSHCYSHIPASASLKVVVVEHSYGKQWPLVWESPFFHLFSILCLLSGSNQMHEDTNSIMSTNNCQFEQVLKTSIQLL